MADDSRGGPFGIRRLASTPARRRQTLAIAVPMAAVVGASLLPLPASLPDDDQRLTRVLAIVVAGVVATLVVAAFGAASGRRRRGMGMAVAVVGLMVGGVAALTYARADRQCTAEYAGRPVLIGTELTPVAAAYRAANPDATDDALLFDAAGAVDAVWTPASIARCRLTLMGAHVAWWPCFVVALAGAALALAAGPSLALPGRRAQEPSSPTATPPGAARQTGAPSLRYDVFLSYRHGPPDATVARELAEMLEQLGYAVAIDGRDFAPNAHFLTEMERCIRESRFTLALLSRRYLHSGPCEEESLICRVLDFGDRQRRLIPVYLEPVTTPAWLHGLVGIELHDTTALVEPVERLVAALGPALSEQTTAGDAGR